MSARATAHDTDCANCGATLTGPYCSQCGQHAHGSARSMATLLHEAWHVFTHADSRVWRTLLVLLFRPGVLTLEYFQGRRERYLPPVRLYLIASVLFFSFVALQGGSTRPAGESAHVTLDCSQPEEATGRVGEWVRAAC